jgi:hypothetical protein
MRVAVKLVIVTDPLPPATDEENEPAACDPLIRLSVIVRDVAAFNATVPTLFAADARERDRQPARAVRADDAEDPGASTPSSCRRRPPR